jgi:hypothetical protein
MAFDDLKSPAIPSLQKSPEGPSQLTAQDLKLQAQKKELGVYLGFIMDEFNRKLAEKLGKMSPGVARPVDPDELIKAYKLAHSIYEKAPNGMRIYTAKFDDQFVQRVRSQYYQMKEREGNQNA